MWPFPVSPSPLLFGPPPRPAVLLLVMGALVGCSTVTPIDSGPDLVPLRLEEPETIRPFQEGEAESILERAGEALRRGELAEALRSARTLVEGYPTTLASVPALMTLARAHLGLGQEDRAKEYADRYAELLPEGDPRHLELRLFAAERLLAEGRPAAGLDSLLALPREMTPRTMSRALEVARDHAAGVGSEELSRIVEAAPVREPLVVPFLVEQARRAAVGGDEEVALGRAETALAWGAVGVDENRARGVLEWVEETRAEAREMAAREAAERRRRAEEAALEAERRRLQEAQEEARRRAEAEAEERRREEAAAGEGAAGEGAAGEGVERADTGERARTDAAREAPEEAALDPSLLEAVPVATVDPANLPGVRVEGGTIRPFRDREAASLLETAREAWRDGAYRSVLDLTDKILRSYPSTYASGDALWLRARTLRLVGREEEATEVARGYLRLLPEGDARRASVRLFRAERVLVRGDAHAALDSILALPTRLLPDTRARALGFVRGIVSNMDGTTLAGVVAEAPLGHPLAAPLMTAYARALHDEGDDLRASRFAEAAIALGAEGPDLAEARSLLSETIAARASVDGEERARVAEGRSDEAPGAAADPSGGGREPAEKGARSEEVAGAGLPAPVPAVPAGGLAPLDLETSVSVGALLPLGGSPAMRRFAERIEEGVRVALASADTAGRLALALHDDGGRPDVAATAARAVVEDGVLGLVGPLDGEALRAAASAGEGRIPIVTPTALDPEGRDAVYSLAGPDPGAALALAEYAMASGFEQVVVVHPDTEEHATEARAFRERMLELGGSVLRILSYEPGSTYFQDHLETTSYLAPHALVLPVPPSDVSALAPQVSFFGLDTLGIRVLGTDAWTDETVLREVAPRHMDGVVVATSTPPSGEAPGLERFREAYQDHFQRALRDPVAALGYDAASLLVEALRRGARTGAEMVEMLETIEDFPGATGILSVEDGRIVRRHHLACIHAGRLRPVLPGQRPTPYRPERRGDPALDEPERVPLGPLRVYCPGIPVPDGGDGDGGGGGGR